MRPSQLLHYDYSVAKLFMFATILFGIIGMVVGVVIAFQMACPELNYIAGEYSAFGRLRPLHTNGIIFWLHALRHLCHLVLHRTACFKGLDERVAIFDVYRQASLLAIYACYGFGCCYTFYGRKHSQRVRRA